MPPTERATDNESSINRRKKEKSIDMDGREEVWALAFLNESQYIVSGGHEGKIRRWQVEDGKEVGKPMHVGRHVTSVVTSRDGKWIVGGCWGVATVWNARTYEKVIDIGEHDGWLDAVDISPDGTKIATGSNDGISCVWSLSTGQRLLGPWRHNSHVSTVKFSPDGRLLANATRRMSVQIYDIEDGRLHVNVSIKPNGSRNHSLAWAPDSINLFILCPNSNIYCLDALNGRTLSRWPIHSKSDDACISMAGNGRFIAASADSSFSFWDTATHKQIGPVIQCSSHIWSMVISENFGIVNAAGKVVSFRALCDILPLSYIVACAADDKAHLEEIIRSLRAREETFSDKILQLEETVHQLRTELLEFQQDANLLRVHERRPQCEALYAEGRIIDAANSLRQLTDIGLEEVTTKNRILDWLIEFTNRCTSKLEDIGDEQLSSGMHDEALASYSAALSLSPATPNTLLTKWATTVLTRGSANDALCSASKFKLPRFFIYHVVCDTLEADGRVTEAIECFRRMQGELSEVTSSPDERERWEVDFRGRLVDKLERLGDAAVGSNNNDTATKHYTDALTLDPTDPFDVLLKRSKTQAAMGLWGDAIADADKAIKIGPSSSRGYDAKRVALLGAQRYDEAIVAYNDMLLKLEQSADPLDRERRNQYVSPSETKTAIQTSFRRHQRDIPLVLINNETGFLRDGKGRMVDFEVDPAFKALAASMTNLDSARIDQTVEEYLRYATFSHTWEGAEPLYQDVLLHESVHKLPQSPAFSKLLMFCMIAQKSGLRWAWADSCCINKMDGSVLQESLTSMFKWYHHSSLTIIHLKGILSHSDLMTLMKCLWNTRAWTLQEFFASKVIRFYTEDWKPYYPHEIVYNHKESAVIMGEMAAATGVDAQVLLSLHPGSDNVRQKLCLAATRVATKQEDMAYSLFGIFDVSIPVTYGEGQERALGRLLQEVLTRSGDITILAWTGKASEYNSGIPAEISVYREPLSPYIPSIGEDDIHALVAALTTSPVYVDSAMMLYDRVAGLPPPNLASRRLRLSCIMFPIRGLGVSGSSSQHVYCAVTSALGKVRINTTHELTSMDNLVLVYPWIQCLVDPAPPFKPRSTDDEIPPLTPVDDGAGGGSSTFAHSPPLPSHAISPSSHSPQPHLDRLTRSLRLFVRLRQPSGALLLVPLSLSEYKRVASDSLIVAQLLDHVSPQYIVEKIRTLDIL